MISSQRAYGRTDLTPNGPESLFQTFVLVRTRANFVELQKLSKETAMKVWEPPK